MSAAGGDSLRPIALRKAGDDRLVIDWADGVSTGCSWQTLRNRCPCASCREDRDKPPDPLRILKPNELAPLKPVKLEPVGRYAYKFTWSDGHDTGIYTLELLRQLDEPALK